jgi:hypothetical protein
MGTEVKSGMGADVVRTDVVDVLRQVRNGNLVFELSQEMERLVESVRDTRKGGTVTLKLEIKPLKAGSEALNVSGEVKAKLPRRDQEVSIFYPTRDNTLSRKDPRQMNLPMGD